MRTRPTPGDYSVQRQEGRRGLVLILVMIVVAMVSLAGMSFVALMSTENKATHLRGDELQVECLLGSGEESIKGLLELTGEKRRDAGSTVNNPDRFRGVLVVGGEKSSRQGRFSVLSPKIEDGKASGIRWGLENESSRLNLAVLPEWERRQPGAARNALLKLPGMSESVADAILDWIDADDAPRQFGAEADYYAGVNLPYAPRNAAPGCIEELLLVKGVTREMLFGADSNFNYRTDPGESGEKATGEASNSPPWASLLTLYSAEKNLTPEGKPRINLNQKNLQELHRQLTGVLDQDQADFIILFRQFGPLKSDSNTDDSPMDHESRVRLDFNRPGRVRLGSVLEVVGARVAARELDGGKRILVNSPFENETSAMNGYLPKLLDNTTVAAEPVIRGRVNVDLADRDVLKAVPGLDEATVGRIIGARGSRGSSRQRHATWLLTEGLVPLEQMKRLLPYLTTAGDVYRAQIVGFYDNWGPIARAEVVVDATGDHARRVYWKDLRLLGLGYSRKLLGGESKEEEDAINNESALE